MSVILWVFAVEECLLSGVPPYYFAVLAEDPIGIGGGEGVVMRRLVELNDR